MFQCGINSHRLLVRGYGIDESSIHEETSEKTNDTDLNIEKEINNIKKDSIIGKINVKLVIIIVIIILILLLVIFLKVYSDSYKKKIHRKITKNYRNS